MTTQRPSFADRLIRHPVITQGARGVGMLSFGVAAVLSIATSQAIPSATGTSETVPVLLDTEQSAQSQCFKLVRTGEAPPEAWSPTEEFNLTITYDIPATSTLPAPFTATAQVVQIADEELVSAAQFGANENALESELNGETSLWGRSEADLNGSIVRVDLSLDTDRLEEVRPAFGDAIPHMRIELVGHYVLTAYAASTNGDNAFEAFDKNMEETGRELLVLPVVGEELDAHPECRGPQLANNQLPVRMERTETAE